MAPSTPRSSIREQIAAKRAEFKQNTPKRNVAGASTSGNDGFVAGTPGRAGSSKGLIWGQQEQVEEKDMETQVRKAVKSGKLDISSLRLNRIPPEVYLDLLGMDEAALSNPPPPPEPEQRAPTVGAWDDQLRNASIRSDDKGSVFGAKAVRKERVWIEPEELTSVRANGNEIESVEKEFSAFGGLRVLDFRNNRLSGLPDGFSDFLKLTSLDLAHNKLTTLPPSILLLPALQSLALSHNEISTLDFSSPLKPSEEGLSYGAGFLSTAFQRAEILKAQRPIWPTLYSLNLGHNPLSIDTLAAFKTIKGGLPKLRTLNLEHTNLSGTLDVDEAGLSNADLPDLISLVLSGNNGLRALTGTMSEKCKVEMVGCNVREQAPVPQAVLGPPSAQPSPAKAGVKAYTAPALRPELPTPEPDLTIVYRTVPAATFDGLPLSVDLDIYLPPQAGSKPHATLIWFHGGGMLQGNKENLCPHFRRLPSYPYKTAQGEENIIVISPNYRLAPQVPILDILSDCTTVLSFVRTKLNDRLAKEGKLHKVDPNRICLSGGSVGGYIALISGLQVPKEAKDEQVGGYRGEVMGADGGGIKCLAPFYPISDLTDPFWATETNPVPWKGRSIPHEEARPHIDPKAAPTCTAVSGGPRSCLYAYMLQHGLFPGLLFMRQKSVGQGLDSFRPEPETLSIPYRLDLLKNGREQEGHIPIYLSYGTADTSIQPLDKTIEALRGVPGELEIEVREGADHGYDEDPGEECEKFRDWLGKHLL